MKSLLQQAAHREAAGEEATITAPVELLHT